MIMINHWKVIALALTLALVTLSAGCKRKPQAQIVLKDAAVRRRLKPKP